MISAIPFGSTGLIGNVGPCSWLVSLVSDWLVWDNGNHPIFLFSFSRYFHLPLLGVLECRLSNGFTQLSNFRYEQNRQ